MKLGDRSHPEHRHRLVIRHLFRQIDAESTEQFEDAGAHFFGGGFEVVVRNVVEGDGEVLGVFPRVAADGRGFEAAYDLEYFFFCVKSIVFHLDVL